MTPSAKIPNPTNMTIDCPNKTVIFSVSCSVVGKNRPAAIVSFADSIEVTYMASIAISAIAIPPTFSAVDINQYPPPFADNPTNVRACRITKLQKPIQKSRLLPFIWLLLLTPFYFIKVEWR